MKKYKLTKAFTFKNITFYGGPSSDVFTDGPFDLVMALNKYSSVVPAEKYRRDIPSCLPNFKKAMNNSSPIIRMDWPDMGTPDISKSMWEAIIEDIKILIRDTPAEVAVCCMAGHGRTGTALAILHTMLTGSQVDPVKYIREQYYDGAVETDSQVNYIEQVTGVKSTCEGSKPYGFYYGGGWNDWNYIRDNNSYKSDDSKYYSDEAWRKPTGKNLYEKAEPRKRKFCTCGHDDLDHFEEADWSGELNLLHCLVCNCYGFCHDKNRITKPINNTVLELCKCNHDKLSHYVHVIDEGRIEYVNCEVCNCYGYEPKQKVVTPNFDDWMDICQCLHEHDAHFFASTLGNGQREYCTQCNCNNFSFQYRVQRGSKRDIPKSAQKKSKTGWPRHKADDCVSTKCPYHGEWN